MQIIAAILFVAAAVIFRLVTGLSGSEGAQSLANFAPMIGIAFCSAMVLPVRIALPVAFGGLLVSDLILNAAYASQVEGVTFWGLTMPWLLVSYSIYAGIFGLGRMLSAHRSVGRLLAGTVAGVVAFYVLSNTASWLAEPRYVKSLAGWWQAQTIGLPGYPPSLVFLRNQLAGNVVFAALFVLLVLSPRESESGSVSAAASTEA